MNQVLLFSRAMILAACAMCLYGREGVFVKHLVSLEYPPLAAQAQIQGEVILKCIIGEDGRVSSAEVVSGNRLLSQSAQENALKWLFDVAEVKERGPREFRLIYRFHLEGVCLAPHCTSVFSFTYPNLVIVVSQSRHWTPSTESDHRERDRH